MDLEEIRRLSSVVMSLRQQADALQGSQPSMAQNLRAQAWGIENSIQNTTGVQSRSSDDFFKGFLVGTLAGALASYLMGK